MFSKVKKVHILFFKKINLKVHIFIQISTSKQALTVKLFSASLFSITFNPKQAQNSLHAFQNQL